jgi:Glycosyl hydrolases family 16
VPTGCARPALVYIDGRLIRCTSLAEGYYSASTANVHQDGRGHLLITPVKSGGGWTSGRIETVSARFVAPAGGEMNVTASIDLPAPSRGLGYWPAFWMLGAGFRASGAGTSGKMTCAKWPSVGEIDVLEDVNALSQHSGTLHCGTAPGGPCSEFTGLGSGLRRCPACQSRYHTYSVIVNRTNTRNESITWYLDGRAYFTVTERQVSATAWKAAVDHGFFLILDVAMGGGLPNAVCGCTTPTSTTTSRAAMGASGTSQSPYAEHLLGLTEQGAVGAERWLAAQMGVEHGGVIADLAAANQIDEASHGLPLIDRVENDPLQAAQQPDGIQG